jgi:arylsulfatase A-like enzyme
MELSRRQLLAASAAVGLGSAHERPLSYLVVVADQLTWWMADPAQRGVLDLPAIDRLRAEGTVFERCYTNSPICSAARMTLRTGLFPHANPGGEKLVHPVPTVEEHMREAGYVTRYFGKWHLSRNPDLTTQFVDPRGRPHWNTFIGHEKSHTFDATYVGESPVPVSTAPWDSQVMTDFAVQALRADAGAKRPFFAHVNYLPPHQPYHLYPASLKVYGPPQATLRPNVPTLLAQAPVRIANYMNMTRGVDLEIARLLDELDALGIDVVVIFTSDHGDMLYSQNEEFKQKPWEEAVRVPLVVRGPGWAAETIAHPVALIDLAAELVGIGQGTRLREPRDSVYFEMVRAQKSWAGDVWRGLVTDDGWKLAVSRAGPRLLYDLADDPYELADLAGQGLPREGELLGRMHEWAWATGDDFFA